MQSPLDVKVKGLDWIPVSQAAKILRVTRQRIHQLIDQGVLDVLVINHTTLVSAKDVQLRYDLTHGMRAE